MKIVIIGADGQLGSDLCKVIPKHEQIPLTIKELDIANREQVQVSLKKLKPDVVINTAAYNKVDDCEDHELEAFWINVLGTRYLAQACQATEAALVHISSDYVFDGLKGTPYNERDQPNPQSIYGITKYTSELVVRSMLKKYFLIRTSGLYGTAGCLSKGGGNFVDNVIDKAKRQETIRVVDDEAASPTYTFDLAHKINELIRTDYYGLYHITNSGGCSWYNFAAKILELKGIKADLRKISRHDFAAKAQRPVYSVLENAELVQRHFQGMRSWQEALAAYLKEKQYL